MCQPPDMLAPGFDPPSASGVTLAFTLAADRTVTLECSCGREWNARQGNEVEEVEDPPISPSQGNSVTLRLTGHLRVRTRVRVRARARDFWA